MHVKDLGIPIYDETIETPYRHVLAEDLKLAIGNTEFQTFENWTGLHNLATYSENIVGRYLTRNRNF